MRAGSARLASMVGCHASAATHCMRYVLDPRRETQRSANCLECGCGRYLQTSIIAAVDSQLASKSGANCGRRHADMGRAGGPSSHMHSSTRPAACSAMVAWAGS